MSLSWPAAWRIARREETGATLIVITHDPALAERCERIVTLADGRIATDRGGI